MSSDVQFQSYRLGDVVNVVDYVANGSFAALKENVTYLDSPGYAMLMRTADFNSRWNGNYVWVDRKAFDFLSKSKLAHGDLVLSNVGSVGVVFEVPNFSFPMTLGPNSVMLRATADDVHQKFLYYYFMAPVGQSLLKSISTGTVQAKFNKTDLRNSQIYLPNIEIQEKTASILAALDDRITLLRETNTTLEAIAQALFKSWFVDFDPVHAKMQGRAPEGMDQATAALFPDSFEDSELGPVPKGWGTGTLDTLADLNPESWSSKHHPERILYVDLANTKAGQIDDIAEFSFVDAPSRARRVLREGDVIVGTVRPGNRSFARIAANEPGLTGSTGFAVLRAKKEFDQALIYIAATCDEAIDRLAHLADGGAYPAVRPEAVGSTPLVIPPAVVRKAFGDMGSSLFQTIGSNQERCRLLAQLRDALLPRLIAGQLRISDALTEMDGV